MNCSICKKKVKAVSDELWGRCPACAKAWLERLAIPFSWTDAMTPTIVAFSGIKTPYEQILKDIRDKKLHVARMKGQFIPEMKK